MQGRTAQNRGTPGADELKRDLRLEGAFPRFLISPVQLGKLTHGEKLLLLLLVSGRGEKKVEEGQQRPKEVPKAPATFLCSIKRTVPHHKFLCKLVINKIQALGELSHQYSFPYALNRLSREQVIELVKYLS